MPVSNENIFRAELDGSGLYIEIAPEIENFISESFGHVEKSSQWGNGGEYHEFYYNTDLSNGLADFFDGKYNSYGGEFIEDGKVNIALLRTKGLSEGKHFELSTYYANERKVEAFQQLKTTVCKLYNQFIKPVELVVEVKKREVY